MLVTVTFRFPLLFNFTRLWPRFGLELDDLGAQRRFFSFPILAFVPVDFSHRIPYYPVPLLLRRYLPCSRHPATPPGLVIGLRGKRAEFS